MSDAEFYGTERFICPPEPPVGSVLVARPDRGGPYWERNDADPDLRWRQSMCDDHRQVTWGEALYRATRLSKGFAQLLPRSPTAR